MLMAAARLNLPAVFLYGGSILPGHYNGPGARHRAACSRPSARAPPARSPRTSSARSRRSACPTEGSCAGHVHRQHDGVGRRGDRHGAARARRRRRPSTAAATTSRTSRAARSMRLLELEHPAPPDHDQGGVRERDRRRHGARRLDQRGAAPARHRQRGAASSSSSTTSTASARAVPHIADMKPHGKYHMIDLDRIGGVPVVMQQLLDAGLLHGDCLTVTGKTIAENLADARPARRPTATSCTRCRDPIHAQGGIAILTRLARAEGRGREGRRHRRSCASRARARVFDGEDARDGGDPRRARSSPATSSSSATRARRAARACARCSRSPAR